MNQQRSHSGLLGHWKSVVLSLFAGFLIQTALVYWVVLAPPELVPTFSDFGRHDHTSGVVKIGDTYWVWRIRNWFANSRLTLLSPHPTENDATSFMRREAGIDLPSGSIPSKHQVHIDSLPRWADIKPTRRIPAVEPRHYGDKSPWLEQRTHGWPLRSIGSTRSNGLHFGLRTKRWFTQGRRGWYTFVPFAPIWLGLITNSIFFAAPLFIVMKAGQRLRTNARQKRGLCPRCRYDLSGLPDRICPECGNRCDSMPSSEPIR